MTLFSRSTIVAFFTILQSQLKKISNCAELQRCYLIMVLYSTHGSLKVSLHINVSKNTNTFDYCIHEHNPFGCLAQVYLTYNLVLFLTLSTHLNDYYRHFDLLKLLIVHGGTIALAKIELDTKGMSSSDEAKLMSSLHPVWSPHNHWFYPKIVKSEVIR